MVVLVRVRWGFVGFGDWWNPKFKFKILNRFLVGPLWLALYVLKYFIRRPRVRVLLIRVNIVN